MPAVETKLVEIETSVEKLSQSVEKVSGLLTDLIARLAVLEAKFVSVEESDKNIMNRLQKETDDTKDMIQETRKLLNDLETKITLATILNEHLKSDVKGLKDTLDGKFVTKDQFEPIKRIVYAISGSMILGVVGSLINLVLKK